MSGQPTLERGQADPSVLLLFCEAAGVPVIWATQLLEQRSSSIVVKKGLPSRGELTDAAAGERAECVMLNMGPYLRETLATLNDVLKVVPIHQSKKTSWWEILPWETDDNGREPQH